jgi:predicted DNA-binding WGR domain protein
MHHLKVDADYIFKGFDILELQCVIPEKNRRRFYRLEIAQGLWCPMVIRAWGRIGCSVRVKIDFFEEGLDEALAKANKLLAKKIRRGYKILTEPIVENAIPVHPVEIKNVRIRRNNADDNLSFPFFQ